MTFSIRDVDLRRHRDRIARALADYERLPAVVAAHAEAERMLRYRAPQLHPSRRLPARIWQDRMATLRSGEARRGRGSVSPREVVQVVCEIFALDHDAYFPDRRAVEFALARQVLMLRSMRQWRPGSQVLEFGGAMLHDAFAVFALALRRKIEADTEAVKQSRQDMLTGWEVRP